VYCSTAVRAQDTARIMLQQAQVMQRATSNSSSGKQQQQYSQQ
jgi:phosphohistidine phosphatase SixA